MVDGELDKSWTLLLDEADEISQGYFVEIALNGDGDGIRAADGTGFKRFLQFQGKYFAVLVLDEVGLHYFLPPPQMFQQLDDLDSADDGVGAGDGGHNISCHIFDLVERLEVDRETVHSQVGGRADKVDHVIVVFLEYD